MASAIHHLREQTNHPLLGQFELGVGCPSCLVWLVCSANQSMVHYNLFFLGLLHNLTSVRIYVFSPLAISEQKVKVTSQLTSSQSDIFKSQLGFIFPLSVPQCLSNDLGITPHSQNILCHHQQFKYHFTSLPLRC